MTKPLTVFLEIIGALFFLSGVVGMGRILPGEALPFGINLGYMILGVCVIYLGAKGHRDREKKYQR